MKQKNNSNKRQGPAKLGVICSQFPEMHETFVARELVAIRYSGTALKIYSLKNCHDRVIHAEGRKLLDITTYVPWDEWQTWRDAFFQGVCHPFRSFLTLLSTLVNHRESAATLLKSIVVWVQALALVKIIRKDGITHLHAHWATMPTSTAVILSQLTGIPFSFTAHAWDIFVKNGSLKKKVRLAQKVITCTSYNQAYLQTLYPAHRKKIVLHYHGVDLNRFQPAQSESNHPNKAPIFLTVGRFVEQKGYDDLISAYRILRQKGVAFRAILIGDGPLKEKIRKRIFTEGLLNEVTIRPGTSQTELQLLYRDARAFVLPSVIAANRDRDGIPNVIFEAMAMERAVISTPISGIPEAVIDEQTGLMVPPHDPEALAQSMEKLILNPGLAHALGRDGRRRVLEKFDQTIHMKTLILEMRALTEGDSLPKSTPKRIRILYLIDKLQAAGTQTNLLEIIRRLDRNQFEPHVIALVEGGTLTREFESAGTSPVILSVKRAYGISGIKALAFLVSYLKKHKIDALQTHFLHADILGGMAAKLAGVKKTITCRRDEGFWRTSRQLFLSRILNRLFDVILANSEAVRRAVLRDERIHPENVSFIHNGIHTDSFCPDRGLRTSLRRQLGIQENETVIGCVGNMRHPVKGQSNLIEAMSEIVKDHPRTRLLLIGGGRLRNHLEALSARLELQERVLFLGIRRDIQATLNAFDIFCLPSLSEGFSNAILEAMAAEKPVVATNVGGNPEIVEDGKTGFLVPPKDPSALAYRITQLLKDAPLQTQFGKAARKRVLDLFSVEHMIGRYESFYKQLLGISGKPPKVMHLIWSLDQGGAEQVVMHLAKNMDRSRFESVVCCLNERGRYADGVEKEGIKVVALHKRPNIDLMIIPKLMRVLKQEKIQLLHTHLFTANLWGRIAAKLAGVPVVSTEHNVDVWKKGIHVALDKMLVHTNSRMIFVSKKVQSFYQKQIPNLSGKSRVLYNGVDLTKFDAKNQQSPLRERFGIKENEQVIGIVGRLVPQKCHGDFVEAFRLLKAKKHGVKGLIVGEGPLRESIEEKIRKYHLENDIFLTGFTEDMPAVYRALDVFTLSSSREGFPMTMLEAMAAGVPVVSTDVGGVNECIQNGQNGFLVPPGDVEALANSIAKILGNEDLRKTFIERGKQCVEESFSIEKMARNHEVLYQEILGSSSAKTEEPE